MPVKIAIDSVALRMRGAQHIVVGLNSQKPVIY